MRIRSGNKKRGNVIPGQDPRRDLPRHMPMPKMPQRPIQQPRRLPRPK
ncbi:hypothetical protein [Streptosporangium sp. KLBMP 9127]|nr:hypothetical protein [Streptosporangium sp. KLBMP 9127]